MKKNSKHEEQYFHNQRFDGDDERKALGKYYSVRISIARKRFELFSKYLSGKKVLEYGCGDGSGSERLLKHDAILTGIDISEEGINKARQRISKSNYKAEYFVMDAESTTFEDDYFDVVVGLGILHHLDLNKASKEITRILKHDGHAIFEEPLGHNPAINLYRTFTPDKRTSCEHPLKMFDIRLLSDYFQHVEVYYYTLTTLLAVPFRNMFFFKSLYSFLEGFDRLLFQVPAMRKYAWTALIHVSQPKK